MKNLLTVLIFSSSLFIINANAETLYINGKAVDKKIIDQTIERYKRASPMASEQLKNPKLQKEILNSIGMQQTILMEGNSQNIENSTDYRDKVEEIKPMIYAQVMQQRLMNEKVSDNDLKARYEHMKADMLAHDTQYKTSHILVKDEKTANEVIQKLKKGAKFATLAKKYSTDTGSKVNGGDLGWSDGSSYAVEFTAAMKALQKGKYTEQPVKTNFGYHVILLVDTKKNNNKMAPFDQMKDQIKQQLAMEKVRNYFDTLKAKYKVEVK